jgi:ATP-dependent DNA helicase RecQ
MDALGALHDAFGLAEFRPGQREVIDAVLAGRPTVAVMPTGAGKSLCYQLPAVMTGGTGLVVSPLIALMKDQVDALAARGIPAAAITSGLTPDEQAARLDDLARGRLRLCYVAPERFKSPRFEAALAACRLDLLAIDEAHCISEWGHDFRPDYLRLGDVVARHRPPRLVALTATATPEVRRDVIAKLGMTDPAVFVRGFDRPNLRLAVQRAGGARDKGARLSRLVRERRGQPVLVYAATRKNAEAYADALLAAKVRVRPYHAGLADEVRAAVQDAFMGGTLDVIVATNAFGMGVDKRDVRAVIHADLPRSPEAYYQEAGRAGRDGLPADCILLFNHSDVKMQEFLIDTGTPTLELLRAVWRAIRSDPRCGADERRLRRALPGDPPDMAVSSAVRFLARSGFLDERDGGYEAVHGGRIDAEAAAARADIERAKLRAMVGYAYTSACRRRTILDYFGDDEGPARCGACDVCDGAAEPLAASAREHVRAALSLAASLGGRFGRTRIAAILSGEEEDRRFDELVERGALRREGKDYARDLVRALEGAGLVAASPGEYPTVSITPAGRRVLAGAEEPRLAAPAAAPPRKRRRRA